MANQSKVDEIRENADIVDVISNYIQLNKKGKNYMAVCPFHEDHNPSLSVSSDRQMYKCFVCGNAGSVFQFVQNYEKIPFLEAVKKVADLTNQDFQLNTKQSNYVDPNSNLNIIMDDAVKYTNYLLKSDLGLEAMDYLRKRNITDDVINHFKIGYNPSNNELSTFLKAKNYNDEDLIDINLATISGNNLRDFFANRILFPITDKFNKSKGFTARLLNGDGPKYLNTGETKIFTKGDILYNYYNAKESARKKDYLIVVEGVLDVIAFYRADIFNVVATVGTACTSQQLKQMSELSNNIYFCYDGDKAGVNANLKVGKEALINNLNVTVLDNTTGLDPDDLVNKYGKEGLENLLTYKLHYLEYSIKYMQEKYNLNAYEDKKIFSNKISELIAYLHDPRDRDHFTNQINSLTGFNIVVRQQKPIKQIPTYQHRVITDGIFCAELKIITQMIGSIEACEYYKNNLGFLINDTSNKLAMIIIDQYRINDQISLAKLFDDIDDENIKQILLDISEDEVYQLSYDEIILDSAIKTLQLAELDFKSNKLEKEINAMSKVGATKDVINKMLELSEVRKERMRLIEDGKKN